MGSVADYFFKRIRYQTRISGGEPIHCEVSVVLPALPEFVWEVAQDPALRPNWDLRIARYEVLGPQAAGTQVRITFRVGFMRPVAMARFLRWSPPSQSALQVQQGTSRLVAAGAGSWTFRRGNNNDTILTSRFTHSEEGLPWWMPTSLYRTMVEWDTKRSFRRLIGLVRKRLADKVFQLN